MWANKYSAQFAVENEIFNVEIAIFIAEIDSGSSITLEHPDHTIPNIVKLLFEKFVPNFG